jgi:hypothetical protein
MSVRQTDMAAVNVVVVVMDARQDEAKNDLLIRSCGLNTSSDQVFRWRRIGQPRTWPLFAASLFDRLHIRPI